MSRSMPCSARLRLPLLLASVACFTPMGAFAATWVVDPGGGGTATTVAAGLALASAGDTVLVHPGTYVEHLVMRAGVTLRSSSGPGATVLDGSDSGVVITCSGMGPDTVIEGFSITRGRSDWLGAGIACGDGASPLIRGNHFYANLAYEGSAIGCNAGSSPIIEQNLIRDNSCAYGPGGIQGWNHCNVIVHRNEIRHNRGAMSFGENCSPTITGNLVIDNYTDPGGGGAGLWLGWGSGETATIRENLFIRNHAMLIGGAIYAGAVGTVIIEQNTFVQNASDEGGDAVYLQPDVMGLLERNIVSRSFGYGTAVVGRGFADCNDLWSNQGTDYQGLVPGDHDLRLDPQFCDHARDDYSLSDHSPCADAPDCGLIGALGVGCAPTATMPVSWGHTKALFR